MNDRKQVEYVVENQGTDELSVTILKSKGFEARQFTIEELSINQCSYYK